MVKIGIGSSVYNNCNNVKNLICSILALTDFPKDAYRIVICDDGTSDTTLVDSLESFCKSLNIPLIKNCPNRGVPYSWNRLTEYYDCEYMVILNDDTRLTEKNWLNHIVYFLDNNPHAGIVDWRENIIGEDGGVIKCTTAKPVNFPKVKLKPSGPFFAFRKDIWKQICQPDGSVGFWEDLLAYREELDIAAEFYSRGFYTFQLPFNMEHLKGQTFSSNPEIRIRKTYSPFLPSDEYWDKYVAHAQIEQLNEKVSTSVAGTAAASNFIRSFFNLPSSERRQPTKLEYSRAMFAKKWETRELFNSKGYDYLQDMKSGQDKFLKSIPKLTLKYLDQELKEQEIEI